jgi:hypothetical protein
MFFYGVFGAAAIIYAGRVGQRVAPAQLTDRRMANVDVHPMDLLPRWLFRAVVFLVDRDMMCQLLFLACMWPFVYATAGVLVALAIGGILQATHIASFDQGIAMGIVAVLAADFMATVLLVCAAWGCIARQALKQEERADPVVPRPGIPKPLAEMTKTAGEEATRLLSEMPMPPTDAPAGDAPEKPKQDSPKP